ncbi:MAG: cutD 1 [Herbinix sp.]|nr:cutD 1 [Herbinix sp.]
MCNSEVIKGIIFNIQRFSLHDGPGIRTTVFLKGCNMRCAWCHNPESMRREPQISIDYNRCNSCGECVKVCQAGVHKIETEGLHQTNIADCKLCGACISACPVDAISMVGKEYTPQEVIDVIIKEKKYYERSAGGVTFSGGEPTFQYEFLLQLLQLAKAEQLHICLETNGLVSEPRLIEISQYVDLFLFDYKHSEDELHRKFTGTSNQSILNNLELLNRLQKPVILRCPIIPGINDTREHFDAIRLLKQKYKNIEDVELMPYHTVGVTKWRNIGEYYSLSNIKAPQKEQIDAWHRELNL